MKPIYFIIPILLLLSCTDDSPTGIAIGPDGGTFEFENGIKVVVPSGAFSSETQVEITLCDETDIGDSIINNGLLNPEFFGGINCEPEGLILNSPIEITFPVNLPDSTYILTHGKVNKTTDMMDLLKTDIILNPGAQLLTLYIDEFSTHAAVSVSGNYINGSFNPEGNWDNCVEWDSANGTLTSEDDCKCGQRRYTSSFFDYQDSDGCQIVRSVRRIDFIDCDPPQFYEDVLSEKTDNCPDKSCHNVIYPHYAICLEGYVSCTTSGYSESTEFCPKGMYSDTYEYCLLCLMNSGLADEYLIYYYKGDYNVETLATLCTGAGGEIVYQGK